MNFYSLNDVANQVYHTIKSPIRAQAVFNAIKGRWYPRNTKIAYHFLSEQLQKNNSKFLIYGAGTHTRELLCQDQNHILTNKIFGCIDKNATELKKNNTLPWPIFSLEEIDNFPTVKIILSHHEYELSLRNDLIAYGIKKSRIIGIYSESTYGESIDSTEFKLKLSYLRWEPNKTRLLLVNVRPTTIVPLEAWQRLNSKFSLLHINLTRNQSNFSSLCPSINCEQSLCWLGYTIHLLKPNIIYIYDQFTTGNIVGLFTKSLFPKIKIVVELYDSLKLFFCDPNILTTKWYWRQEDLNVALTGEEEGLDIYDGIVIKESPKVFKKLIGTKTAKMLAFKPVVCASQMQYIPKKSISSYISLVWAGSIIPSTTSQGLFGDNQLLPVVNQLLRTNFSITLFTGHTNFKMFSSELPDYAKLLGFNSNLHFHPKVSRNHLIKLMAQNYDYGIILCGKHSKNRKQGMSTTFASKLITYLAAGLPVIISREFSYMSDWVNSKGVGVIVSEDDAINLRKVILATNYSRLKLNVRTLQKDISTESKINRLQNYLSRILIR